MKYINTFVSYIKEGYYEYLGGETPYTNDGMINNIVIPNLGKDFDSYIMFKDKEYYDKLKEIKTEYNTDFTDWKTLYKSSSYQGHAEISPDKRIIKASIMGNGGIIGALYIKK